LNAENSNRKQNQTIVPSGSSYHLPLKTQGLKGGTIVNNKIGGIRLIKK
jgi:hypothetical protein